MSDAVIHRECEQMTPEWFELRRGVPTASRFKEIMTPTGKPSASADKYVCELVAQSIVGYTPEEMDEHERTLSVWTERGQKLEPEARAAYAFATGVTVDTAAFITRDGLGCSPDGLVGLHGGVEIKCPAPKKHMHNWLSVQAGEVPKDYLLQVHGSLIVSDRQWWDFVSYCPGLPMAVLRVERDLFTEKLVTILNTFTSNYADALAHVRAEISQEAA